MSDIYNNIKLVLDRKKLTFKWLANEIGYSRQGLTNGLVKKTMKYETIEKISKVLDVRLLVLFTPNKTSKDNDNMDFVISFLSHTELTDASTMLVLSKRYDKFSDQLSFIKDYYIESIISLIAEGYLPRYESIISGFNDYLVPSDRLESIKVIIPVVREIPFSQWNVLYTALINNTYIIHAFYFEIFEKNLMNIKQYLGDGMIKDKEILKYWKEWKKSITIH